VTSQVDLDGQEIRKVAICDVDSDEWDRIKEKADVSCGIVADVTVMFNGTMRFAGIVKALKEGATLSDEDGKR
jgi:hypothetical protein